jgi:hypothetical protein
MQQPSVWDSQLARLKYDLSTIKEMERRLRIGYCRQQAVIRKRWKSMRGKQCELGAVYPFFWAYKKKGDVSVLNSDHDRIQVWNQKDNRLSMQTEFSTGYLCSMDFVPGEAVVTGSFNR